MLNIHRVKYLPGEIVFGGGDILTDEMINHFLAIHKEFQRCMKEIHDLQSNGTFNQSEFLAMIKLTQLATDYDFRKSPVNIGVSMKALSKEINVSPAMVTKIITILEKGGYVKRMSDANDRRGVKVFITQSGFDTMMTERSKHDVLFENIFKQVGEEKTKLFLDLLDEFISVASNTAKEIKKQNTEKGNYNV